ncbi:hypothetical protein INR49_031372, partial [Caranx melampygus]
MKLMTKYLHGYFQNVDQRCIVVLNPASSIISFHGSSMASGLRRTGRANRGPQLALEQVEGPTTNGHLGKGVPRLVSTQPGSKLRLQDDLPPSSGSQWHNLQHVPGMFFLNVSDRERHFSGDADRGLDGLEKKHQAAGQPGHKEREVRGVKCQTGTAVDSRMPQPLTFNLEEREDSVVLFSRAETQPPPPQHHHHHHHHDSAPPPLRPEPRQLNTTLHSTPRPQLLQSDIDKRQLLR